MCTETGSFLRGTLIASISRKMESCSSKKITMLLVLSNAREARRGTVVFTPLHFFSLLHLYFSSSCFQYIFFMFASASYVSAIKLQGFARADFTPTPGSIQQAGGGTGLSLVVSTRIFLGDV